MSESLLEQVRITRVKVRGNGTASETPTKGDIVDMGADGGYHNVLFVAEMGNVVAGAEVALRAAGADVNDTAQMTLFEGAASGTAGASNYDDTLVLLDVVRPNKRYIEPQLFHVTQNAPFDSILAIQYNGRKRPPVNGATVILQATIADPVFDD